MSLQCVWTILSNPIHGGILVLESIETCGL